MPPETLLKIDHLSLKFGDRLILRDVNAEIVNLDKIGQVVAFLGPSGVGKSTLSRCIAGLQKPTEGQVWISDPAHENLIHTSAGSVCMVPQNYPMFEYATVRDNFRIAAKMGGLSQDQAENMAAHYVETFGLASYLDLYPKQLSGGTRQRCAIVRQLMAASNYIVLDEPFSGLDPIMKKRALDAIMKLAQLDTYNTIIIVSHNIPDVLSVADHVWVMGLEKGKAGARIVETYDMVELGFAYRPDIKKDPKFQQFAAHVEDMFQELA